MPRSGRNDAWPAAEAVLADTDVEVSVVLPCRNEGATVAAVVADAWRALEQWGYRGEVLVVDNASSDDSAQRAAAAGARVISQPVVGYGAACLRGLEAARGAIVVLLDADGTYTLADTLPRFVEPLRAGYDLVLGTRRNGRMLPGAMGWFHRHVGEPLQTALSRRFLPFPVSDVRCGLRAIRREALEEMQLGRAVGMDFATEMLLEAARLGLEVVEVPVEFRPRPAGPRRRWSDGWRVVRQLLLLSPTPIFFAPGLILLLAGLGLELALLPGPLRLGGFQLDYHFMFVGSALALLGLQVLLLGLYAKTYVLVHRRAFYDRWLLRFHRHYTLERGVAVGATLFFVGFAIDAALLYAWLAAGRGAFFAVRPAIVALTLMVLGAEILFASIFLSLLRGSEFGRS